MVRYCLLGFSFAIFPGCAGLGINSLSLSDADKAHNKGGEVEGYVVYQPMIVVEVGEKELCIVRNEKGQCVKIKTVCGIGEPITLPDFSKPYILKSSSGLGKAGVDVTIQDGWRLSNIKDNSDNTGLLGVLAAAGGVEIDTSAWIPSEKRETGCGKSGLYRLVLKESTMEFEPILEYNAKTD